MKKVGIIVVILFCFQLVNAQTCEETINKAKKLYEKGQYEDAQKQFQAAVIICNSEIAKEYIKLCEECVNLKNERTTFAKEKKNSESSLNALNEDASKITRLENENRELRAKNSQYANDLGKLTGIGQNQEASIKTMSENLQKKSDSLEFYKNERDEFYSSLREMGVELNECLEGKLKKGRKKEIKVINDTISNDSLVSFMKNNIKLVKEIKTLILF